jgi:hypothetical protein
MGGHWQHVFLLQQEICFIASLFLIVSQNHGREPQKILVISTKEIII